MRRLLLTLALALALGLSASASAETKLLAGIDHSDKTKISFGLAVSLGGPLWSVNSLDFNLSEGEKKVEPMIAALFDLRKLPIPLLNRIPAKAGPILGPEYEWTDEGSPTGDALGYFKGAIGGVFSVALDKEGQSGVLGYYKAAIKLDDALTAPLGPSVGFRLWIPFASISGLL